ncbi:MAG: polyprenyl synthetase family protein [Myxococcota bacterium]
MQWIRPSFDASMAQVQSLIEAEVSSLSGGYDEGPLWTAAVNALTKLVQGPRRMVRPQLVMLGAMGAGGDPDHPGVVDFAAGVEMLHLFALIHDDVMDNGTVRRGHPTLHRVLGGNLPRNRRSQGKMLAVLLGDLLHSQATARMTDGACKLVGGDVAIRTILEGSRRAVVGQFLDLQGWAGPAGDLAPAAFRQVLLNKGGHHSITAPLMAGWRLVVPGAGLLAAQNWGDHIGLAFQGLDDLQDVLAEPGTTGKDNLQDLREGRLSLVSHLLRLHVSEAEWETLRPTLGQGMMTVEDRGQIFHLLARHQLIPRGLSFVREELAAARKWRDGMEGPAGFRAGLAEVEVRLEAYVQRLETLPHPA